MCLKYDVSKVHSVSSQTNDCFRQFVSSQSIWLNLRQFVSPQEFGGLRQFVSSLFRLMWLLSRAFANHHPWYPESLYLVFTIPGIQGLYISSSWAPRISKIYLIFTIPGIQGLYTSSCLVPRISLSNIYHPWHPGPLHINILGTRMVGMIKIR